MTDKIKIPPFTAKNLRPRDPQYNKAQSTTNITADTSGSHQSRNAAKEALMVARERRGLTGRWLVDWKTVAPW